MSKKQSLAKLNQIINEVATTDTQMFYRNSFALSCYLITQGEVKAGKKNLSYLFNALGRNNRLTYFSSIAGSIEEYAVEYASEIAANLEINRLFDKVES